VHERELRQNERGIANLVRWKVNPILKGSAVEIKILEGKIIPQALDGADPCCGLFARCCEMNGMPGEEFSIEK
jgi:hypothetical protein